MEQPKPIKDYKNVRVLEDNISLRIKVMDSITMVAMLALCFSFLWG